MESIKLDMSNLNEILNNDFKIYDYVIMDYEVCRNCKMGRFANFKDNLDENYKKDIVDAFKDCILLNPNEIIAFILSNNALDYIQKIVPFVKSYFPNGNYYFDYMPDPDNSELDYLTLLIKGVGSLVENSDTVKEIELKILDMEFLNNSFKRNFFIEVE